MTRYSKATSTNNRIQLALALILTAFSGCHAVSTPYRLGPLLAPASSCSSQDCSECPNGTGDTSSGGALPARLCARVHDNFIHHKIAEHREAKALPPWPRFHPLPTRPVFYPKQEPEIELQPELLGTFQPH